MITLRALGNAEIETSVTTLTPSQEIVFAAALYLVLERGKRVSRTGLASLLWPRGADTVRSHRLRQTILQLKKLGIIVQADRDKLQLLMHDAQSDLDDLRSHPPDLLEAAKSLEFLPGYNPIFSEAFRDWVESKRVETHATVISQLIMGLAEARKKADWSACETITKQCQTLDPFNESVVLAQAEIAAMRGSKREAVAILNRYIDDVGETSSELRLPATLLRRRIVERVPERANLSTRESAFVGRNCEMATLISYVTAARKGHGCGCLVTGEAGIGKSRLTSEIAKFAELEGVRTEKSICRRSDLDRPLSVFVDLVPHLRELPGALGCSQETLALLRRLTDFDARTIDAVAVNDAPVSDTQMRRALLDLFDAVTEEQSLLLIVEDVQWLDSSSRSLLSAIVEWASTKKLFILLNERLASRVEKSQIAQVDLRILHLAPLEASFAKDLIGAIVGGSSSGVTTDVLDWLLTIGEGNPFFLQELGKQWLETGKQHEVPPSISAVVDDRLSRLSGDALQVLQTCAVLGVNATIDRVEGILEVQSHRLLSAMQELSVAGMLQEEGDSPSESFTQMNPRHDLLSSAALRRLARTPLALLHRRAGTVLERETAKNVASMSLLWACAFHWRQAGDRERAFGAARSCAEHLLEVGLPFDAAQAFEKVLEYCVTDEQRVLVLPRLAVALQMQGQWKRSIEVLRRARLLGTQTAPNANAHDDVELALFHATWVGTLDNTTLLRDVRACVRTQVASVSHRIACGLLGLKVASGLSQTEVMHELYQTIHPLLDDAIVSPATRFEIDIIYHSVCGDAETAAESAKQYVALARAEKSLQFFAGALANAAVAHRLGGQIEEAEKLFTEAFDYSITHGLTWRAAFNAYSLVRLYLAEGNIRRAREMIELADSIDQPIGDVHLIADKHYLAARVALEEGKIEEAASKYEIVALETNANQSLNRRTAVLALGIRIGILQQLPAQMLGPMVDELESAHLLNRGAGWQDFETHALYLGLGACGKLNRATELLTEYAMTYRREKWPLPRNLTVFLEPPMPA